MVWVLERSGGGVARELVSRGLRQQELELLQDCLMVGSRGFVVLGGWEGVERVAARDLQKRVLVEEV